MNYKDIKQLMNNKSIYLQKKLSACSIYTWYTQSLHLKHHSIEKFYLSILGYMLQNKWHILLYLNQSNCNFDVYQHFLCS